MNNDQLSYEAHKNNLINKISEKEERLHGLRNHDNLAYVVTKRVIDVIQPFLSKQNNWLTVGDYNGLEANYLLENNQKVVASDITDIFLHEANKEKLIEDFKVINVENIDYPDNSFDYVFCKEAFHHFPKAYLGLYEMIRCSRKAAIIIEPIDIITKMPLLLFTKNLFDRINPLLINKIWRNRFSFEIVGNYVFKISEREIEKMAMGIALPYIAFKRINIIMNLKLDKSILTETPTNKAGWRKTKRRIIFRNILSYLKIIPYNHLCCVVFKSEPSAETMDRMNKMGYMIIKLPENPYLKTKATISN